jgi:glyoxylase I family protein
MLNLERITRPDWEYPGAWFQIGNQQMHLIELNNPDPITGRPKHGGHDRHVAFTVSNIDLIIEKLDEHNVDYSLSRSGRRALFFRDLDANAIEICEQP